MTIPKLEFGFFYQQILDGLLKWRRTYLPELSDESEFEPTIQLLRAFALVGHNNNVVGDMIGQESILSTCRLKESAREHLRPLGYVLATAQPANVQIVSQLSGDISGTSLVVPLGSIFSTEGSDDQVFFEATDQVAVTNSDRFTSVLGYESGSFVDYTSEANSFSSPEDDWAPAVSVGDMVYFGHSNVMWNHIRTFVTTATNVGSGAGVWEYYSGDLNRAPPDAVAQISAKLRLTLNQYLGKVDRSGAIVQVKHLQSGVTETAEVIWTGAFNVVDVGLLGQSEVSLDVNDYIVGSEWEEIPSVTSTSDLGDIVLGLEDRISFPVPQDSTHNWNKTTVNSIEAYWLRFRWIVAPTAGPTIQYATINDGQQFVISNCVQGRTTLDSAKSSNGSRNQSFQTSKTGVLSSGDVVTIDGDDWTKVDSFIFSGATDQHYTVTFVGDDSAIFTFGDGVRGAIPNVGNANISLSYRYGAQLDGNVGPLVVTKDRNSLSHVDRVFNPRQASGWSAPEGDTQESLELAKQLAPALWRTKEVAISTSDVWKMALRYVDDNGSRPFGRAFCVPEGFGPKTVELVVGLKGGGLATEQQLEELELFFNGDESLVPPVESRIVSNQKVVASNAIYRPVSITVEVSGERVDLKKIANHLSATFDSESVDEETGLATWQFGSEISLSRIDHEVHVADSRVTKVTILQPTQDIVLTNRELPQAETMIVNKAKVKK